MPDGPSAWPLLYGAHDPQAAASAAAACRQAAEDCRLARRHVEQAADSAVIGWTGTAREEFDDVVVRHVRALASLAVELEGKAADIERAGAAADAQLERELSERGINPLPVPGHEPPPSLFGIEGPGAPRRAGLG